MFVARPITGHARDLTVFLPSAKLPVRETLADVGASAEIQSETAANGHRSVPTMGIDGLRGAVFKVAREINLAARLRGQRVGHILYTHSLPRLAKGSFSPIGAIREALSADFVPVTCLSGQPCAGLHSTLDLGLTLLSRLNNNENVLVISADAATTHDERFFFNSAMGDAVFGTLLDREEGHRILSYSQMTKVFACAGQLSETEDIQAFRAETHSRMRHVLGHVLACASADWGDVSAVFPHTPNLPLWDQVAKLCKVPRELFVTDYIGETGHLNASDCAVHMWRAIRDGRVGAGDLVLLASAGFGGTHAATAIRVGG